MFGFLDISATAFLAVLPPGPLEPQELAAKRHPELILPGGTLILVTTDDLQSTIQGIRQSALGRIFTEQEVKDFLGAPLKMAQTQIGQGMEQAKAMVPDIDKELQKLLDASYGRAFMALTHFKMNQPKEGEMPSKPDVGVVFGLEPTGGVDALAWLADKLVSLAPMAGLEIKVEEVKYGNSTYRKFLAPVPDAPSLCQGIVDGISVLSLSESGLQSMLDLAEGKGSSLAESDPFKGGATHAAQNGRGIPAIFVDLSRIMRTVDGVLEIMHGVVPDSEKKDVAMVRNLLAITQLEKMGQFYATASWNAGAATTRIYSQQEPGAGGLCGLLMQGRPLGPDLLNLVPKNALSFSMGSFDIASLWDTVMNGLKEAAPEIYSQAMGQIHGFEAQIGGADEQGNPKWDVRRDLIGAVGGQYFMMSIPGAPKMFGPSSDQVLWVETSNAGALDQSLKLLFSLPGQMGGLPLAFTEVKHGELTINTLDMSQLGPMAGALQPCYTIVRGRMYFGSSTAALKKMLDYETTPPAENITKKDDFSKSYAQVASAQVSSQGIMTSLSYGDTADNFEGIYSQLMGIAGFAGGMIENLPIDLSLMPSAEAISQHMFGSVAVTRKIGENAMLSESYGPFGPELYALVAGAAGIGIGVAQSMAPQMMGMGGNDVAVAPEPTDPATAVMMDLENLGTGITVYRIEYQKPPSSLEELIQPKPDYPSGFLESVSLPVDPWGNAYRYKLDGKKYRLWSCGPNGQDEGGAGDDISKASG